MDKNNYSDELEKTYEKIRDWLEVLGVDSICLSNEQLHRIRGRKEIRQLWPIIKAIRALLLRIHSIINKYGDADDN